MKTQLTGDDGKLFTIEDSVSHPPRIHFTRLRRMPNHFNIFKWFITTNIILVLIFCGYALWSLYQLENAMKSKDEAISLSRYFDLYDTERKNNLMTASTEAGNDSLIIADFQEWKRSILKSLEDLKESGDERVNNSNNLKFLLHSMSSVIKNLLEDHKQRMKQDPNFQKSTNFSELTRSKLIMTNLTDLEIHILKEFTKFKLSEKSGKNRFSRAAAADEERDSGCDINVSIKLTNDDQPVKMVIAPANRNEGVIKIKRIVNYTSRGKSVTDTRECFFNVIPTN